MKQTSLVLLILTFFFIESFRLVGYERTEYYSFIYPSNPNILLNDNMLLLTIDINTQSIQKVKLYLPWDSIFHFDMSNKRVKATFRDTFIHNLPSELIVNQINGRGAAYHQNADTATDMFNFKDQIKASEFFYRDTTSNTMQLLLKPSTIKASVKISGWIPAVISTLGDRIKFCKENIIAVPIYLKPGLNIIPIEFKSPDDNILATDTINAFYKLDLDGELDSNIYKEEKFHSSDKIKNCINCHNEKINSKSRNPLDLDCSSCHKAMIEQKNVHGIVSAMNCNKCHNDKPETAFKLLYDPIEENKACFTCHSKIEKEIEEKSNVHGPVGGGKCGYCHSPHASPFIFQLRRNVNDVCFSCHPDKIDGNHPVVFHPVGDAPDPRNSERELNCISCHYPHASDNKSLLTNSGSYFALCQECHNK